jgi:hypothetical protein
MYIKISFLVAFTFLISCHPKDPAPAPKVSNSLKILSVSPGSNIQSGVATDFDVEVAYHYETGDSIEINIGFNSDELGMFPGNASAGYLVINSNTLYAHTDTVNFVVNATVINSGPAGSYFRCFANMAKLPHSSPYSPILGAERTLSFE